MTMRIRARAGRVAAASGVLSLLCMAAAAPAPAIILSVSYDPSVPASHVPVIDQAARDWEARIVSGGVVAVTVFTAPLPSGLLGLASNITSSGGTDTGSGLLLGVPSGGHITFTPQPPQPFFVDPTPADDAEYLNVVSPPTYLPVDPAGPAVGQIDLLTLAIHEFGHVLGFSSAFQDFAASIQPSQSGQHQAYAFPVAPALGDPLQDYLAGHFLWGSALMPQNEENPEEGGSVGGKPSHLDDVFRGDLSGGLFDVDVMNPSLLKDERIRIAAVDLDLLADAYGYSVVPEPSAVVQALAALLALLGLGWLARPGRRCGRSRWVSVSALLALGLATSACGDRVADLEACKPLIERRCAGQPMERKCRSMNSAACNMQGPETYRGLVEGWERSRAGG